LGTYSEAKIAEESDRVSAEAPVERANLVIRHIFVDEAGTKGAWL